MKSTNPFKIKKKAEQKKESSSSNSKKSTVKYGKPSDNVLSFTEDELKVTRASKKKAFILSAFKKLKKLKHGQGIEAPKAGTESSTYQITVSLVKAINDLCEEGDYAWKAKTVKTDKVDSGHAIVRIDNESNSDEEE